MKPRRKASPGQHVRPDELLKLWQTFEDSCDEAGLRWGQSVFEAVLGGLPLNWRRRGTWLEAWVGEHRIAFAPHNTCATFYFQGGEAVRRYRMLGGNCPTGRVSIKAPLGSPLETALLQDVIAVSLGFDRGTV